MDSFCENLGRAGLALPRISQKLSTTFSSNLAKRWRDWNENTTSNMEAIESAAKWINIRAASYDSIVRIAHHYVVTSTACAIE